jgi:hypothetical protein
MLLRVRSHLRRSFSANGRLDPLPVAAVRRDRVQEALVLVLGPKLAAALARGSGGVGVVGVGVVVRSLEGFGPSRLFLAGGRGG